MFVTPRRLPRPYDTPSTSLHLWQIAIVAEIAVAYVRAGAVEEHAKIALGDPECLGDLLAGLFVQDAEEHDLPLEACHPQDAPPNPRQFFGARDDGDAVLRTGVE